VLVVVGAVARVPVLAVLEVEVVAVLDRRVPAVGPVDVHVPRVRQVERVHRTRDIVDMVDVEVVDVPVVEIVQVALVGDRGVPAPAVVRMGVRGVGQMLGDDRRGGGPAHDGPMVTQDAGSAVGGRTLSA
jgi:hypothetical protein